jgi:hypothetical protein
MATKSIWERFYTEINLDQMRDLEDSRLYKDRCFLQRQKPGSISSLSQLFKAGCKMPLRLAIQIFAVLISYVQAQAYGTPYCTPTGEGVCNVGIE